MKKRVYLDNCCFNRPYDDLDDFLVWLEAEAIDRVQQQIRDGATELAWSYMLDHENAANPHKNQKDAIAQWKYRAVVDVEPDDAIVDRAEIIGKCGLSDADALHISCAIQAKCHYFLTTDRRILKKKIEGITLLDPLDYIQEMEGER